MGVQAIIERKPDSETNPIPFEEWEAYINSRSDFEWLTEQVGVNPATSKKIIIRPEKPFAVFKNGRYYTLSGGSISTGARYWEDQDQALADEIARHFDAEVHFF